MSRQFVTVFASDDSGRLLLTGSPDGQLWLPHRPLDAGEGSDVIYRNILSQCGFEATAAPSLHIRSHSVATTRWTNYLYRVKINKKSPGASEEFRLVALNTLHQCADLRSDEILSENYLSRIAEVQHSIAPRQPNFKEVLDDLRFDETMLEALATAIIDEVWPCEKYSERSFESLTTKLYGEKLVRSSEIFFRSVCQYDEKYAEIQNLSIVLALLEPALRNGGTRCRFLFNFYHRQGKDRLLPHELDEMLRDIHDVEPAVRDRVPDLSTLCRLANCDERSGMSISQFSKFARSEAFPGIGSLLRAPRSIYQYFMYDALTAPCPEDRSNPGISDYGGTRQPAALEYAVQEWTVSLDEVRKDPESFSWWKSTSEGPQEGKEGDSIAISASELRSSHYATQMLELLKYYVAGGESKKAWSLGDNSVVEYYQTMMKLCEQAKPLFLAEKRMLELKSPAYVFGDMHGKYKDLLRLERSLWPMGPQVLPCSFVFIADFVDRSRDGFLLMAHLLSCKILAPDKIFLVRGDHGEENACRILGEECHEFYIESGSHGSQMFKKITDVFDHLPLAAIIDDRVFCVHGGFLDGIVPFGIEAIDLIQNPLVNPTKHPLARQLMSLDVRCPAGDAGESDDPLYLENKRRRLSKNFSRETLSEFLGRNRLSFVIRGHQDIDAGPDFHEDKRLLQVYSSNDAQESSCGEIFCALVDQDALRLIRFEPGAESNAHTHSGLPEGNRNAVDGDH